MLIFTGCFSTPLPCGKLSTPFHNVPQVLWKSPQHLGNVVEIFHTTKNHVFERSQWMLDIRCVCHRLFESISALAINPTCSRYDPRCCGKIPHRLWKFPQHLGNVGERCGRLWIDFHTDVKSKIFNKKSKYRKSEH